MYNKVVLAGNLTRDVDFKYIKQGTVALAVTGLAVNRKFRSANGEQKDEVLFVDITFFGRTAEVANQYLKKGSNILIDGRLTMNQWEAQDGSRRSKITVTVESLQMLKGGDISHGDIIDAAPNTNAGRKREAPSLMPDFGEDEESTTSQVGDNGVVAFNGQTNEHPNFPTLDVDNEEIPF